MVRRLPSLIAASFLLLAAASAPVSGQGKPVDSEIDRARAEAAEAQANLDRLEQAAGRARDEAARLAAERRAAAAAITASEARITAVEAQARLAQALVVERAERLARQQAPLAALLAGIVTMGRRPPLVGSVDSGSLDEFIRVRALLDTTLPVIRKRSAALSAELEESRRLQASANRTRADLAAARKELQGRQQRFAQLEARATERAASFGAGAVGASDVLVASTEGEARLRSQAERRRAELRLAADLGGLAPAPARPGSSRPAALPLTYQLPVTGVVQEGVGAVGETGIRARGLTLAAYAGQEVRVPAGGTIAFAGPFRRHDGVVIIDHGRGWMTLMTGVRTPRRKGERVRTGDPLGRALGTITVELSTNGRPVSAAIMAGSSPLLSNKRQSG